MKVTCPKCKRRIRIRNQRVIDCDCGHQFSHRKFYGDVNTYLVDTNIFIYALNEDRWNGEACKNVLNMFIGELSTTIHVIDELLRPCKYIVKVLDVKNLSPEVMELRYGEEKKTLSLADKSLIQCAIDNPYVGGIITYDIDIKSVVPSRLIRSEKPFFIGTADEFLKKRGRK